MAEELSPLYRLYCDSGDLDAFTEGFLLLGRDRYNTTPKNGFGIWRQLVTNRGATFGEKFQIAVNLQRLDTWKWQRKIMDKVLLLLLADLVPQIDPARERSTIRMLSFYSVRRHLSTDDYEKKFQTLLEKYVALPVVQKNLTCGELNHTLDNHILALGHSAPEPTFVLYAETEASAVLGKRDGGITIRLSLETLEVPSQCMNDLEAQQLLRESNQDLASRRRRPALLWTS
ncbi:hypothetical protein B0H13DRAFT_2272539 [Mycena leptocephala]|nr:hypothetical protein B0H13DRAFT_2272539 [Mycena leptocephala]